MLSALVGQGGGRFNPLAYGSPVYAFWAEDPSLSGTADGAEVTSWTNRGSDGTPAVGTTGTVPTFVASGIGGRASLDFDGTSQTLKASGGTMTTGGSIVLVYQDDTIGGRWYTNNAGGSLGWIWYVEGSHYRWYSGALLQSVTQAQDTSPHVAIACATNVAGAAYQRLDGVEIARGTSGALSQAGFSIGSRGNGTMFVNGKIALLMAFATDVTQEPWFAEFERGLLYHYGVLS